MADNETIRALLELVQRQGSLLTRLTADVSALMTYVRRQPGFDPDDFARVNEASRIALDRCLETGEVPSVELLIEMLRRPPGAPS